MNSFSKIFKNFSAKEKKETYLNISFMFIVSLLEAFSIGLILPISSMIIKGDSNYSHLFIFNDVNKNILFLILLFVLLIIIKNIFFSLVFYRISIFCEKIRNKVAAFIFDRYIYLDYISYLKLKPGETIRNLSSYPSIFQQYVFNFINLVQEFLILTLIIVILLFSNFKFTILGFFSVAVLFFFSKVIFRNKFKYLGQSLAENTAKYSKYIHFSMNCIKDIKIFQAEEKFKERFNKFFQNYSRASALNQFLSSLSRFFVEIYLAILLSMVFLYLYLSKIEILNILPMIGLFAFATVRLFPTGTKIIAYYNSLIFLKPMIKEILSLIYQDLNFKNFSNNTKSTKSLENKGLNNENHQEFNFQNIIEVNNLNYNFYSINNNIQTKINNLNFKIKKNSIFGIIGKSGTGKSTLLNLLCGLIDPIDGEIIFKNKDIKKNELNILSSIGYVPQEVELFDGTILNNITMFNEKYKDYEKINEILKVLNLYDFINNLDLKLETLVGEQGIKFSGGQRQRIGIARALVKKPEILIFDESTSSVDSQTENDIIEFIKSIKKEKTIIFVTHDKSLIEIFDETLDLNKV